MARSYRRERLNEAIKELLSELVLNDVKDPRVGLVTITRVKVSQDLFTAKVYFSVMGDDKDRELTKSGLESARNFFRKIIGRELKLRSVPELRFEYDDALDRSLNIEEAIKKIHEDDDRGAQQ